MEFNAESPEWVLGRYFYAVRLGYSTQWAAPVPI